MPAILELPEVRQRVSTLTVEEYHRLDEYNEHGRRTELIRGIVIEKMSKSPSTPPSPNGCTTSCWPGSPAGWVVRREDPLTLKDSEPEPDIAVVRGTERDFFNAHPQTAEWVVEIAVSSPVLDRENASLYAEAGVAEYWIVLGTTQQVEIYRQPAGGRYRERALRSGADALECAAPPGIHLRVSDLFA
ncbi:MAG: Uma2 family endonuclease [Verrucomicrobia bacterium]|nr:Uma2 family endonuclease [Verrucomicrobiota bacterium]